jgi:hypothetical protein
LNVRTYSRKAAARIERRLHELVDGASLHGLAQRRDLQALDANAGLTRTGSIAKFTLQCVGSPRNPNVFMHTGGWGGLERLKPEPHT